MKLPLWASPEHPGILVQLEPRSLELLDDTLGEFASGIIRCVLAKETLRVSKDGFFHLVMQFPQVGIEVMSELASRLYRTSQALTAARREP